MKSNLFLFVLVLTMFVSCKPQEKVIKNISCAGTVTIQYDKVKISDRGKPIANKNLSSFTVYFLSTYKDTIQGEVNGKIMFEKYLSHDEDLHNLNDYFVYSYLNDTEIPILKITSKTDGSCFDIPIDKEYKLIYVFYTNKKWIVRFSNIYYVN
jgi:hypothetical protein